MKKLHLTEIKQFAPACIARERQSPDLDVTDPMLTIRVNGASISGDYIMEAN